jgi:uncharacterized protein YjbJ (UPF0337 family)
MIVLTSSAEQSEEVMDRDRVKGVTDKAKGSVKNAVGQATGDRKTEAEGNLDKAKGEVKNTVGGIKDKLREEP